MKMNKKNKKGVSEVMGYLLLISFAIFMSFIVYQGLRTYVPVKATECPDGVSVFVKTINCTKDGENYDLRVTIKNNGRYNIAGYFIHATTSPNQTVASLNLIDNLREGEGGVRMNNAVVFEERAPGNFVNISSSVFASFDNIEKEIYSIDILPIRFQQEENRLRTVSCGKALVREKVTCS